MYYVMQFLHLGNSALKFEIRGMSEVYTCGCYAIFTSWKLSIEIWNTWNERSIYMWIRPIIQQRKNFGDGGSIYFLKWSLTSKSWRIIILILREALHHTSCWCTHRHSTIRMNRREAISKNTFIFRLSFGLSCSLEHSSVCVQCIRLPCLPV